MKMIVLDLDGTLLNSQKVISKKTKEALIKAQEKGIKVVLASGRPSKGMYHIAYELEMDKYDGYLISFNGELVYSMKNKEVLWESVIDNKDAKKILDHLENFDCIPMIQDDEYMYVNDVYKTIEVEDQKFNIIQYESRGGNYKLSERKHLGNNLDFKLYKILVAANPKYLLDNYKEISKPFTNDYNSMFTAIFYYEFTNKNANKGLALKYLSNILNIKLDEVVGFGDDLNDLPFLEIIKHSIAMENANPKIKDKVESICKSNDEDGIAYYLIENKII